MVGEGNTSLPPCTGHTRVSLLERGREGWRPAEWGPGQCGRRGHVDPGGNKAGGGA